MCRPLLATTFVLATSAVALSNTAGGQVQTADSAALVAAQADSAYGRQTPDDFARALALWERAAALYERAGEPKSVGHALNRMGIVHRALGRPDSALAYYRRALAVRRASGDQVGVGATLSNIGLVHADLSHPDSALAYYAQALRVGRAARNLPGQAYTLVNAGAVYRSLGRLDSALTYYRAALTIWRDARDRVGEGGTLANIGEISDRVGRPDSALAYYRSALVIWRETKNRFGEGLTLNNIGALYQRAKRPDSALAYYARAGVIWREIGHAPSDGATLHNIGDLHNELGRADSALAHYGQALRVQRAADDRRGEVATLASIGTLHLRSGDPSRRDPPRAAAYFDSAAAVYAEIRRHTGGDANAIGAAEEHEAVFTGWALAWLGRAAEVGAGGSALGALAAAERGRAQALLGLLRRGAGESAAASPLGVAEAAPARPGADLVAEGTALLGPLRRHNTTALTYLVTDDALVVWLLTPNGGALATRVAVRRDTLAALVRAFRGGLDAPGAERAHDAPAFARVRAALDADSTRAGAPRGRGGGEIAFTYAVALRRLAALLLPAEMQKLVPAGGDVVVVPHGALAAVPFGALPLAESDEPVGARYALRFAPSLTALDAAEARAETRAESSAAGNATRAPVTALVVGDPTMPVLPGAPRRGARPQLKPLPPLPGAGREARWVAGRLETRALTGAAATESAVRARLPRASVVHLATHGLVFASDARVRDSFVALAPDSASDGLLTVGEVLDDARLTLTADLVVLSACQTGLGQATLAEGVVGLPRAFLARGARSVLVSLWNVSDEATELLMRRLYTHWLDDPRRPSKAEALRRAQDDVRRTRGFAHPRYWAAFQLVGGR